MPEIVILAGPNGAGKSTLAAQFVPRGILFLNADNIARTLALLPGQRAELAAGRLLLERMDKAVESQNSFAIETNLANRALAVRIPKWQKAGYHVTLIFVWVPSADLAVQRVAARVRSGGHDIPEATIRRRYRVGLRSFFDLYLPLVDRWRLYDNSGLSGAALVAQGHVRQQETWNQIRREVRHENAQQE